MRRRTCSRMFKPRDDALASAWYRQRMLPVLVGRASTTCHRRRETARIETHHQRRGARRQAPQLASLLHVLRESSTSTSPKAGCQQGGCGTCTVLVDGEPRRSCLLPLAAVEGTAITTGRGLGAADELSPMQAAFDEHTPRSAASAPPVSCWRARPCSTGARRDPRGGARGPLRPRLPLHGLRQDRARPSKPLCTARFIPSAWRRASSPKRQRSSSRGVQHEGRRSETSTLRRRRPRHRAHERTSTMSASAAFSGRRRWRSPHHHAAITRLDASKAEALPGVHAVVTTRTCQKTFTATSSARYPGGRAAARRETTSATRGSRSPWSRRGRGHRPRGRRADRDRIRRAAGVLRHPQGARPRLAADPPVGTRLSPLRAPQPSARAQRERRSCVRRSGCESSKACTARRRSNTARSSPDCTRRAGSRNGPPHESTRARRRCTSPWASSRRTWSGRSTS